MHELVIVEGILDVVIPEVRKYNAEKILSIRLRIGELSGVIPECVREYFSVASKNTIAEGAEIYIERTPIRIECRSCGKSAEIKKGMHCCPNCGSENFKIVSGREYYIESVEAE